MLCDFYNKATTPLIKKQEGKRNERFFKIFQRTYRQAGFCSIFFLLRVAKIK